MKHETETMHIQNPFLPDDKIIVPYPTDEDCMSAGLMITWAKRYCLMSNRFSSAERFSAIFRQAVGEWTQPRLLKACIDLKLLGSDRLDIFSSFFKDRTSKCQKLHALFQWLEEDKNDDWKSLFKQLVLISYPQGRKTFLQQIYERQDAFLLQKIHCILGFSRNQIKAYFGSQGKTESKAILIQNPFLPDDKMTVPYPPAQEDYMSVYRMVDWVKKYDLTGNGFSSEENFAAVFRQAVSEWSQQQLLKACIDQQLLPEMKATNIFNSFSRNNKYQKLQALFQWLEEDKNDDWKTFFKQLVFIPSLRGKKKSLLQLTYERMDSFLYQKICGILGLYRNQIETHFVSQGIYDNRKSRPPIPVPEPGSLSGNLLETDHKTESKITLIQNPFVPADKMLLPEPTGEDIQVVSRMLDWVDRYRLTNKKFNSAEDFCGVFRQAVSEWNRPQLLKACIDHYLLPGMKGKNIFNSFFLRHKYEKREALFQWLEEDKNDDWKNLFKQLVLISLPGRKTLLQISYERRDAFLLGKIYCILGFSRNQINAHFVSQGIYENSTSRSRIPVLEPVSLSGNLLENDHKTESKTTLVQNPFDPADKMIVPEPAEEDRIEIYDKNTEHNLKKKSQKLPADRQRDCGEEGPEKKDAGFFRPGDPVFPLPASVLTPVPVSVDEAQPVPGFNTSPGHGQPLLSNSPDHLGSTLDISGNPVPGQKKRPRSGEVSPGNSHKRVKAEGSQNHTPGFFGLKRIPGQGQNLPAINSESSSLTPDEDSLSRQLIPVPEQRSLSGNLSETDHKPESRTTRVHNPFDPGDKMILPWPSEEDRIKVDRMIKWVKQYGLTRDKIGSAENFSEVFRQAVGEWTQPLLLKACIDLNLLGSDRPDIFSSFFDDRNSKCRKLQALFQWLEEDKTGDWKRLFKQLLLIPSGRSNKTLLQRTHEEKVYFLFKKIQDILGFSKNQIKAHFESQGTTESKPILIQNPFLPDDKMIVPYPPAQEDCMSVYRMISWVKKYDLTGNGFSSAENFSAVFRQAVREWKQPELLKACIDQHIFPGMKETNIFNSFSRWNKHRKLQALFQWLEEDKNDDWKSLFKQLVLIPSTQGKKNLLELIYERQDTFLYRKIHCILGFSPNQIKAYFVSQGIYDNYNKSRKKNATPEVAMIPVQSQDSPTINSESSFIITDNKDSQSRQLIAMPKQRSLSGNLLETDYKTESRTTPLQNPFFPEDKMIVPEPTGEDIQVVYRMLDWVDRYRLRSDKFSSAEDFSGIFRRAVSEWNRPQLLKACIDLNLLRLKKLDIFHSFFRKKYRKLEILFQWLEEDKTDAWKRLFKLLALIPSFGRSKKTLLQLAHERNSTFLKAKIADIFGLSGDQIRNYFLTQGIYDKNTKHDLKKKSRNLPADCQQDSREEGREKKDAKVPGRSQNSPTINSENSFITQNDSSSRQLIPVPEQHYLSGNLLETDYKTESKITLVQNPFVPEDKMIVPEPGGEDRIEVNRMIGWLNKYALRNGNFSSAEDFSRVFRRALSEWNQPQLLKACIDLNLLRSNKLDIFHLFFREYKYRKLEILFQWLEEDKTDTWKRLFKLLVLIPSFGRSKKTLLQHAHERRSTFLKAKIEEIFGISGDQIRNYFVAQGIYDKDTKSKLKKKSRNLPADFRRDSGEKGSEKKDASFSQHGDPVFPIPPLVLAPVVAPDNEAQTQPVAGFNTSFEQEQPPLLNSFDHSGSTLNISGNLLPEQKKRHRSREVSPGNSHKRVTVEESKLYTPSFFSLNSVTSGSPDRRIIYPGAEELYHPVTPSEWKKYIKLIRTTHGGTISTAENNCDPLAVALAKGVLTGKFSPADSRVNKHNRLIYHGQLMMRSIPDKQGNRSLYLTYIDTNIAYGQRRESRLNGHVALTGNPLLDLRSTPDNPKESRLVAGNFNEQGFDPIVVDAADLLPRLVKIARDEGGWVYATLGFNRCVPFCGAEREQAEEKLQEKLGHLCGVYVVDEKFNEKHGSPLQTEDKGDRRNELVTFLEPQACYEGSDEECVVHKLEETASIIQKGADLGQDLFDSNITVLIINSHNIMEARAKQNQRPKQEEATPICQLRGF